MKIIDTKRDFGSNGVPRETATRGGKTRDLARIARTASVASVAERMVGRGRQVWTIMEEDRKREREREKESRDEEGNEERNVGRTMGERWVKQLFPLFRYLWKADAQEWIRGVL